MMTNGLSDTDFVKKRLFELLALNSFLVLMPKLGHWHRPVSPPTILHYLRPLLVSMVYFLPHRGPNTQGNLAPQANNSAHRTSLKGLVLRARTAQN